MKKFLNDRLAIITSNIKKIRLDNNHNIEYLAAKLKMPVNDYSELEQGHTELTLHTLFRIAEVLNVSILELIEADEILLNQLDLKDDNGPANGH